MFIIIGLLVLSVIITVHELGHFLAAKSLNVGVVEFSLGMGPVLVHKRFGETVYSLRLFPIGGFCAMYGEVSAEASGKGEAHEADDDSKAAKRQNFMNFKTDWAEDRALTSKSKWQQLFVLVAGPFFNIFLAWLAALILACLPEAYLGPPVITELSDEVHIAQDAGILPGDIVMAVEGREVRSFQDFSFYLSTHPKLYDTGYTLVLYRPDSDGNGTPSVYQVHVTPDPELLLIGVTTQGTPVEPGFASHVRASVNYVRHWALVCFDSLGMLFRSEAKLSDLSGVVGITTFVGSAVEESVETSVEEGGESSPALAVTRTLLNILVFISVNLGIMNMMPLPALDGGRSLICVIEGVSRRQVPEKVLGAVNAVGFAAILPLFGITFVADIGRLIMPG